MALDIIFHLDFSNSPSFIWVCLRLSNETTAGNQPPPPPPTVKLRSHIGTQIVSLGGVIASYIWTLFKERMNSVDVAFPPTHLTRCQEKGGSVRAAWRTGVYLERMLLRCCFLWVCHESFKRPARLKIVLYVWGRDECTREGIEQEGYLMFFVISFSHSK